MNNRHEDNTAPWASEQPMRTPTHIHTVDNHILIQLLCYLALHKMEKARFTAKPSKKCPTWTDTFISYLSPTSDFLSISSYFRFLVWAVGGEQLFPRVCRAWWIMRYGSSGSFSCLANSRDANVSRIHCPPSFPPICWALHSMTPGFMVVMGVQSTAWSWGSGRKDALIPLWTELGDAKMLRSFYARAE